MLQLEEARDRILNSIQPLPAEMVALIDSAGRILANDIIAPFDLPQFDNSAMDGYAVRSEDLRLASDARPVSLSITAEIPAGTQSVIAIAAGACARIFTGSPLPTGADAVVMQEDAARQDATVSFHEPVRPWENVRLRGEDVKAGTRILQTGERVGLGAMALAGALGVASVAVHRAPVIGVLATGNELVESGKALNAGQIYESNRAALAALLRSAGTETRVFPLVADSMEATMAALRIAFDSCDAVVTSGGVSVGELDFVKEAFQSLGGKLEFWRVAIRPGKPFVFGRLGQKHLFGLPGNPVSGIVTALLLVAPAVLRMQGAREIEPFSHLASAADEFRNTSDRLHFMRVKVDGQGRVHLAGLQASHALSSMAGANALLPVPPGVVFGREAQVRVIPFPWRV